MGNPVNDIFSQARQGSVAAVIQVLNQRLADSGIRTRAIFANGILQLLCEAAHIEQLDQESVVERIRQILETIAPRNIRRVKINSRIVQEQQLLWLEEIHREPEKLLWCQEITLVKPGLFKQWQMDRSDRRQQDAKQVLPKGLAGRSRHQLQFWQGMLGGAGLVLLLIAGAFYFPRLWGTQNQLQTTEPAPPSNPANPAVATAPSPAPAQPDPFVAAVRLAEQTSEAGKKAQTAAEWLDLAARWQQASDLMKQVPPEDKRYATAQNRVQLYQQNSEAALQQAKAGRP